MYDSIQNQKPFTYYDNNCFIILYFVSGKVEQNESVTSWISSIEGALLSNSALYFNNPISSKIQNICKRGHQTVFNNEHKPTLQDDLLKAPEKYARVGNFLFFTVYWGVQIYERVASFVSL
jgi:hypothetical protein